MPYRGWACSLAPDSGGAIGSRRPRVATKSVYRSCIPVTQVDSSRAARSGLPPPSSEAYT
eukprot:scaffold12485_cov142-Isochrysis_galbana.AAC.2